MPGHGVFVHKLALTFSTLLSSQVSGAHRAVSCDSAWGNSTYFSDSLGPCQIRAFRSSLGLIDPSSTLAGPSGATRPTLLRASFRVKPGPSAPPAGSSAGRSDRWPPWGAGHHGCFVTVGFRSGRPLSPLGSRVPLPGGSENITRGPRSGQIGRAWSSSRPTVPAATRRSAIDPSRS
jgi:hypothetical protein